MDMSEGGPGLGVGGWGVGISDSIGNVLTVPTPV